jgi:hypothetical protein
MAALENCTNCGRQIGKLETPHLVNGQIVCPQCEGALKKQKFQPRIQSISKPKSGLLKGILIGVVSVIAALAILLYWARPVRHGMRDADFVLAAPVTPVDSATVGVAYDKFNDISRAMVGTLIPDEDNSTDWALLDSDGQGGYVVKNGVHLQVVYSFTGHTISRISGGIEFNFLGAGVDENDSVVFLLDGIKRLNFINPITGSTIEGRNGGYLKPEDVIAMVQAKSIEVQIGGGPYKLSPASQKGIAELAKTIGLQ